MGHVIIYIMFFIVLSALIWLWMCGFDYMNKHHLDYKGDDLFGLDDDDINQIG
jgi:hypothetical protein